MPLAVPRLWEAGALSDAEQQSQREQGGEGLCEADEHGGARPHGEPPGQDPLGAIALGDPPDRDLQQGIGPEERREQQPQLARGKSELVLDQMRGGGHRAAIDIVDEQCRGQQSHDRPACAGGRLRRCSRGFQLA